MTRLSSERADFGSARLYRISTATNPSDAKRLFLQAFPAYPEIIEQSSRLSLGSVGGQARGE